jgi:hypothetical protein
MESLATCGTTTRSRIRTQNMRKTSTTQCSAGLASGAWRVRIA